MFICICTLDDILEKFQQKKAQVKV